MRFFKKKKKTLILYYSQSMGNTKRIAERIASMTGADIEAVQTVREYTGSYDDIMAQGKEEVENGFLPMIKPISSDLSKYRKIVVGSPTWWYSIAPAMNSFLSGADFTGKTVIPFVTFGGYEGHSLTDLEAACKGGKVINSKSIQFDAENLNMMVIPEEELDAWIRTI